MPARRTPAWRLLTVLGLLAAGCTRRSVLSEPPNVAPRVTLTSTPAPGGQIGNYSYELSWAGYDTDGFIDRYRFVVDPPRIPDADTAWVTTRENRRTFTFTADSLDSHDPLFGRRFHTVVVEAVDDRGGISLPASVSFNSKTIAPTVLFRTPAPSKFLTAQLAPSTRVVWEGKDADGPTSKLPAYYRWKIFGPSSTPTPLDILLNPDTLSSLYAPSFADWDSVEGTATGVSVHDLLPGTAYVMAVVAVDVAGAYSVPFSFDNSLIRFNVSPAFAVGPKLRIASTFFDYTFPAGGFFSLPRDYVRTQEPASLPFTLEWSGAPSPGAFVTGYRWAIDISRLDDETPRLDENTDLAHWSRWGLELQVRFGGELFPPGSTRRFYLEAEDNTGNVSLGVVEFTAVAASFERDLLVVDDTRLLRDTKLSTGCVAAPRGAWPTAAELDTFLFATGGVPWKCYPTGTRSTPGILKGYAYDSLSTYGISAPTLTLGKLLHYRTILWMVNGGFQLSSDANMLYPMLRTLSFAGTTNPMLVWLALGGRLWVMGGGIASATQLDFEVPKSTSNVYSSSNGELGPGRFMYLFPHWRSEITVNRTNRATRSARAVGGWPGAPDYGQLPAELIEKSLDTDPVAPNRSNPSDFYKSNFVAEYLTKPNAILELDPTDPMFERKVSVVDTLYETFGGAAGSGWPVMTLYHGSEASIIIHSGFPVWYFRRDQGMAITDWVLQTVFHLTRRQVPR
jgi:hypothetical protein